MGPIYPAAEAMYKRSLQIQERVYGTREHYMTAEAECMFANLLLEMGQTERALSFLVHAHRVLTVQVPSHPLKAQLDTLFSSIQGQAAR